MPDDYHRDLSHLTWDEMYDRPVVALLTYVLHHADHPKCLLPELSQSLPPGLASSSASTHLEGLQDTGVITGYTPTLDYDSLGYDGSVEILLVNGYIHI